MSLTTGAIARMYNMAGSAEDPSFSPVVQVLHTKRIENKGSNGDERWKVVLSDGRRFLSGMCATQLNPKVHAGEIAAHCVLRVDEFIVNVMGSGQRIVILLGCQSVGENPGSRIGTPVDIAKNPDDSNVAPQAGPAGGGGAQPLYGKAGGGGGGGGNPYGGQQRSSPGGNPYGQRPSPTAVNRFGGGGGGASSAPIVRTSASGQQITPISGLNMYSNRWVIRAKITSKSPVRTWSNAKGDGSLFSIDLLDGSGTDVRATFFKEAVDRWNNFLEEGRIYTFSGGRLKVANMQYNTCKSQFEITFDENSQIELDEGTGGEAIREHYDFVKIAQIESAEPNSYVDVLAVVKHVAEPQTIMSKKSGKELLKCELTIEDDSRADIKLTMWGESAKTAPEKFAGTPIVAFKRARVGDYGGRTLSGQGYSLNPDVQGAAGLRQWWDREGNRGQSRSLSSAMGGSRGPDPFDRRKTVSSIKSEGMGHGEKPDYLTFKATITFLKKEKGGESGAWYTACANAEDPCRNMFKATQTSDGNWHCDKCMQTRDSCVRRFIFSGTMADDTSTSWVSVFNEQAEPLLGGAKADELFKQLTDVEGGQDVYDSAFANSTYEDWIVKCKVRQEMVGDEPRIKASMVSLEPVDYVAESREMLRALCV